ncbi:hypothetical protein D3C73_645700 [compost metagenome]
MDLGYWLETASGEIHRTLNYRPYKAAKLMREEDSFFELVQIPLLYTYPGDMNVRVRYEAMTSRAVEDKDLDRVTANASRSYTEALKKVKNQLKNPLSDKTPVMLLYAAHLGVTASGQYVITDDAGVQMVLDDIPSLPQGTLELLPFLPASAMKDCCVLVMFEHLLDQGRLTAQPLTIIQGGTITRLLY